MCKANYYGTNCTVHCVQGDQYTCSSNGTRQCIGRWTGVNCDTLTPCPPGSGLFFTLNAPLLQFMLSILKFMLPNIQFMLLILHALDLQPKPKPQL